MNYQSQLAKEHSRSNTDKIAKTIGNNPVEFKKIIDIIFKEKAPLPQRASWLLPVVNEKHPELLKPYLKLFVDTVQSFRVDGIKRGMLNVLAAHPIPEKLQGKLVNICFDFMASSAFQFYLLLQYPRKKINNPTKPITNVKNVCPA